MGFFNRVFRTLLKQEATININGVPMASYFEDVVKSTMNENAQKVRSRVAVFRLFSVPIDFCNDRQN